MRKRQRSSLPDSSRSRRSTRRWPLGDRSGQVLALFAVTSIPLFAIMALAIDWGLLLTARDEAQRAADSGALAGAAMFKGCSLLQCAAQAQPAEDTAVAYAMKNRVRDIPIAEEEVTVQVDIPQRLVRVFVNRPGVPTFFAHFLGIGTAPIGAVAAARISSGGQGQCVLPFFGPDLWDDDEDDNDVPEPDDDPWEWNGSPPDVYEPLQDDGGGTGYGSDHRDGVPDASETSYTADFGRPVVISSTSPGQGEGALGTMVGPGNFQLWRLPIPDDEGNCDPENPEYATGANDLRNLVSGAECGCPLDLITEYEVESEPGQKWGAVKQGIDARLALDEFAVWQDGVGVVSPDYPDDTSPRIFTMALSEPSITYDVNGQASIEFNNFAEVFIEGYCDSAKVGKDLGALDCDEEYGKHSVVARFIGGVSGGAGPQQGNLIEYLRLVE